MIGQVHLPSIQPSQIRSIEEKKDKIVEKLNEICPTMTKRNGGVKMVRLRNLDKNYEGNDYSLDILIDVNSSFVFS